jgi:chemotaxis protein CheD
MVAEQAAVMVGIGEVKVSKDPSSVLVAYGLGSCVGVCLYDETSKVGGLAHVMLPCSSDSANAQASTKFADQAIPTMLEQMMRLGADSRRMVAKMVGGAKMLSGPAFANGFNIGDRNVDAVKEALHLSGISIRAAEVGGNQGRTVTMRVESGMVLVRTAGAGEIEL